MINIGVVSADRCDLITRFWLLEAWKWHSCNLSHPTPDCRESTGHPSSSCALGNFSWSPWWRMLLNHGNQKLIISYWHKGYIMCLSLICIVVCMVTRTILGVGAKVGCWHDGEQLDGIDDRRQRWVSKGTDGDVELVVFNWLGIVDDGAAVEVIWLVGLGEVVLKTISKID